MKIGIITLSASYNCGSLLQSYALRRLMESYGETEIINFTSKVSKEIYNLVPDTLFGRAKILIRRRSLLQELENEKEAYCDFQKNVLGLSDKEYYSDDLSEVSEEYDVVVAGSDQVWNVCMGDFDAAFFAGWTNKKKIAYAPSLGGHDIRESNDSSRYIEWIKEFSHISVREEIGRKCLEEIINKDIIKTADPTLLYGAEKWLELIGQPIVNRKYIFFYSWSYSYAELRKIVSERSEKKGLPVYVIDAHKWRDHSYRKDGFFLCDKAGPMAFLNLMFYAEECFVESFHGMMFAYMFKKNFWLLDKYENPEHMDTRLKELVSLFKAENRILTHYNKRKIDLDVPVLYDDNKCLDDLLKASRDYLERAITD